MNEDNPVKKALNKAMALCASREYCSDDIRIKINSWGLNTTDAENVIKELKKENFIDDKRYAEAFVKDKYLHNKWGKAKIAAHLRAKKIEPELIESALALLDEDQYKQNIREILESHRKLIKARNLYDLKGKLFRYGLSKGFESHLLYDILSEID